MKKHIPNLLFLLVFAVGATLIYNRLNSSPVGESTLAYSTFIEKVKRKQVEQVDISGPVLKIRTSDGQSYETFNPDDPHLIDDLLTADVKIRTFPPAQPSFLMQMFMSWFPMLLLIGVWIFFMRRMQGGAGGAMNFGKSKAKMLTEDKMTVKFADVAGCEEAKEEVSELVDFLK
ncbi:MAG: cell division protein FtsH, partial [Methylobacter sp.]